MQPVHKCFHRAGKQETNNTSLLLNHDISNSVRTASLACSGKLEKNFRLNKLYTSVSIEQEKIDEDHILMLLVILWEYAWKMQQSRARENYRKTLRKTSYHSRFRGVGKNRRTSCFYGIYSSKFCRKPHDKCSVRQTPAFSRSSRKTIDKHHLCFSPLSSLHI